MDSEYVVTTDLKQLEITEKFERIDLCDWNEVNVFGVADGEGRLFQVTRTHRLRLGNRLLFFFVP